MACIRLGGGLAERNPELDGGADAGAAFDAAPSAGEFGAFSDEDQAEVAGAVFGVSKAAVSRRRDLLRPLTGAVLAGLVPGLHRGSGPSTLRVWEGELGGSASQDPLSQSAHKMSKMIGKFWQRTLPFLLDLGKSGRR